MPPPPDDELFSASTGDLVAQGQNAVRGMLLLPFVVIRLATLFVLPRHQRRCTPVRPPRWLSTQAVGLRPNVPMFGTVIRHAKRRGKGGDDANAASLSSEINDDPFFLAMRQADWSEAQKNSVVTALSDLGLCSSSRPATSASLLASASSFSSATLLSICQDLTATEISQMLIRDFHMEPLVANQVRTIVMKVRDAQQQTAEPHGLKDRLLSSPSTHPQPTKTALSSDNNASSQARPSHNKTETTGPVKQPGYKATIVNQAAVRRKQQDTKSYQLDTSSHPLLNQQLQDFYRFMTEPSTASQEDPIRPATAKVYLLHAKLFLGWYVEQPAHAAPATTPSWSVYDIISGKEKESAAVVIQFILWLRRERHISTSYEASLLRGMIKFLKFRFAADSAVEAGDHRHTYQDIPVIQELRRLHRNAFHQSKLAPKSSNEGQKWLSWPEYLTVVQATRAEFDRLLLAIREAESGNKVAENLAPLQRQAAVAYQKFLVLAIFTSVPDRQRTIRELEIDRTLVKDDGVNGGRWFIKHNPGDYKTGATYGERPPMLLSSGVSDDIDIFIERWRPKLEPKTNFLFVQPKTGNPFTRDSVYSVVSRCCFQHAGKRTNPHLLRDMIVTHVRESNASEKELEALALFMGHSIHMQRTSYDRRTLDRKVAPAIELLESLNAEEYAKKQSGMQ